MPKMLDLIKEALELIVNQRPFPLRLAERLDPATLRALLELVERLKRQGLAGRGHSPGERLKALRRMLEEKSSTDDQVESMAEPARAAQRAAEALELRRDEALERAHLKRRG